MKLLLVGSDKVFSIENFYFKYLKELGVNVNRFTAQAIFYDYYFSGSILKKILFKLGFSNIFKKINAQFIDVINDFKPEVIWIFKGMEIDPNSLKYAKSKGIKLVNYNPDNPFIFTGKGSGNKNITHSIGLYDFHFTYNLEIQKELETNYKIPTALLPFAYDVSEELFNECSQEIEIVKACFLGNPDKDRASFILSLAQNGVSIDVYGNYWEKFLNHQNITIFNPVHGTELWKVLRKYRLQLNLMRVHNLNSHNMRTFEVPGIGGIQVAPFTNEHNMFFKDGTEIFLYKNVEECVEKINYLLNLDNMQANELRQIALLSVKKGKHSYKDRSEFVSEVIKKEILKNVQ